MNYVTRMYHPDHTHKDLRRHILEGMYGGSGRNEQVHTGMTPDLVVKLINHTHKHIDKFILDTQDTHGLVGGIGSNLFFDLKTRFRVSVRLGVVCSAVRVF